MRLSRLGTIVDEQAAGETQEHHWCQEEAPKASPPEHSHPTTTNHQRCISRINTIGDRPEASRAALNTHNCFQQATNEEGQAAYSEACSQAHLAEHDKIKVDLPRRGRSGKGCWYITLHRAASSSSLCIRAEEDRGSAYDRIRDQDVGTLRPILVSYN